MKFPYEVGENGGGAFLLFDLLGLLIVVAPLLFAEFVIGRRGRGDAAAYRDRRSRGGTIDALAWIGLLAIATGFLILSYYAVVGGLTVAYFVRGTSGRFVGMEAEQAGVIFDQMDFLASGRTYGARRVCRDVLAEGIACGLRKNA